MAVILADLNQGSQQYLAHAIFSDEKRMAKVWNHGQLNNDPATEFARKDALHASGA